ncbi:metallophosphoesterase [Salinarchaeum sp. Harcht-Bsk1]|uniref:metallophosphoesterase family protein n=1 Tax=Salinarchaeum sp. Harcht-Bsk1 TaxID=1333523 RepID=UPI0003423D04|nr:metallophosphoesterase [Salinarchaeum sp. Harcht-Bsk1]AGN00847.1 metallophosphoesterase [Salinarchaeum sp. Harcht-Bsk1]
MLVLGDAHADEQSNRSALLAAYEEADADTALQVGDLLYYDLPVPTWFVAGNDEDLDVVESLRTGSDADRTRNVHLLASTAVERHGIRVAGLSGNYAPTQFDRPRSELENDRRRHFVSDDVERATELTDVDVFLAHEAPHGLLQSDGYDVGCKHVDAILRALTPDRCLVGHHHEHVESTFGDTTVVGLAPVWESYYTLDPETIALERHPSPEA